MLADVAEVNGLEAPPQGQGIGTALILAGELEARRRVVPILGLAVEVQNHGTRRLYERLGYSLWNTAWSSTDGRRATTRATPQGNIVRGHADECFYLTKPLSG